MDAALNTPDKASLKCRHGLILTAVAPLIPQLVGSAFNIWYNVRVITPILDSAGLQDRFFHIVGFYNALVFPLGIAAWVWLILSLRHPLRLICAGEPIRNDALLHVRRRVIHLPLWGAGISAVAWLLFIPAFHFGMLSTGTAIDPTVFWHVPVSILVSAFIASTHSYFLIELASHRGLFPLFFHNAEAHRTPGAHAISLRARGMLWVVSAGICPIASLLLLRFAPVTAGTDARWFELFVGVVGIAFGLFTGWMMSRLVANPVDALRTAAQSVASGQLDTHVSLPRADEFGALAGDFNHMVRELQEKERIRETFGLHVGRAAAREILSRDPGLGGVEQTITVMFVDIRSFTSRSAHSTAPDVVGDLNQFLRVMVRVVEEEHDGMINKFLGDGFMALFGISGSTDHADRALGAGRAMLRELEDLNAGMHAIGREPFRVGIGIHTGPAIIGSIGSPQRQEFTAIGSTVNIAARVEQLTKVLGTSLLLTEPTHHSLTQTTGLTPHPPQEIRGLGESMAVYSG